MSIEYQSICKELSVMANDYPGIQIFIAYAGNINETRRYLLSLLFNCSKEIGGGFQLSVSSQGLMYANGSRIRIVLCDNADKIRGCEAHVIWILMNTFININRDDMLGIYFQLRARLRCNKPPYSTRWIETHA